MFYEIRQNNSGGVFVIDENLCNFIYIEAESENQAFEIAERLGCYWEDEGDCECCGPRWPKYTTEYTACAVEQQAQYVADEYKFLSRKPVARIFYADGTVKTFM